MWLILLTVMQAYCLSLILHPGQVCKGPGRLSNKLALNHGLKEATIKTAEVPFIPGQSIYIIEKHTIKRGDFLSSRLSHRTLFMSSFIHLFDWFIYHSSGHMSTLAFTCWPKSCSFLLTTYRVRLMMSWSRFQICLMTTTKCIRKSQAISAALIAMVLNHILFWDLIPVLLFLLFSFQGTVKNKPQEVPRGLSSISCK